LYHLTTAWTGGPEIPLSDRSKAVLEVMARGQRRFVHDSLLEEAGFELTVPP